MGHIWETKHQLPIPLRAGIPSPGYLIIGLGRGSMNFALKLPPPELTQPIGHISGGGRKIYRMKPKFCLKVELPKSRRQRADVGGVDER